MDGEVLEIKAGADKAAPFGSAQQIERKQHAAPGVAIETGSDGEGIPLLRPRVIKSAADPKRIDTRRNRLENEPQSSFAHSEAAARRSNDLGDPQARVRDRIEIGQADPAGVHEGAVAQVR